MTTPYECPHCHHDLRGLPIAEGWREAYGGLTHFTQALSLFDRETLRTTGWRCPHCHGEWPHDDAQS